MCWQLPKVLMDPTWIVPVQLGAKSNYVYKVAELAMNVEWAEYVVTRPQLSWYPMYNWGLWTLMVFSPISFSALSVYHLRHEIYLMSRVHAITWPKILSSDIYGSMQYHYQSYAYLWAWKLLFVVICMPVLLSKFFVLSSSTMYHWLHVC